MDLGRCGSQIRLRDNGGGRGQYIGATVGCRFATATPAYVLRIVCLSAGSTFLLQAVSLAVAGVVSLLVKDRFLGLIISYSPGGLAEVSILALSLGIDVPFVVLHHLARVLLVVSGAVLVFRAVK